MKRVLEADDFISMMVDIIEHYRPQHDKGDHEEIELLAQYYGLEKQFEKLHKIRNRQRRG